MRIAAVLLAIMALAAAPAGADEFYGVTGDQLVGFTSLDSTLRNARPLTGLAPGEHVIGCDVRPTTGALYGIAQNGTTLRFVRIDQQTGAVTPLSAPQAGLGFFTGAGFDIQPNGVTADALINNGAGFHFDVATGAASSVSGPTQITGLAWSQGSGGASLAIRSSTNDLVQYTLGSSSPPLVLHSLGVTVLPDAALDFAPDGTLWMYADTSGNDVWRVNLFTDAGGVFGLSASLDAFCVRGTGTPSFAASTFTAGEGDGSATVTIRRDAPVDGPGVVHWSTTGGTATAGEDYVPSSGDVTFAANQTSANVSVPVVQDATVEGTERVTVHLTSVDGIGAGPDAAVQIADDDVPPPVTVPGPGPAPSPPPPPTPPAPDRTAPVVLAIPATLKMGRSLSLAFGVSEAARTTLVLRLSAKDAKKLGLKRDVATVTLSARLGVNKAVLRLSKTTLAVLRKRAKLSVDGVLTAADAAGNGRSLTVKLTLRR